MAKQLLRDRTFVPTPEEQAIKEAPGPFLEMIHTALLNEGLEPTREEVVQGSRWTWYGLVKFGFVSPPTDPSLGKAARP